MDRYKKSVPSQNLFNDIAMYFYNEKVSYALNIHYITYLVGLKFSRMACETFCGRRTHRVKTKRLISTRKDIR